MLVPLAAETIFHLGSFPVTNTVLNGWLAVIFFVSVAFILRGRTGVVPGKLQNAIEMLLEWLMGYFDSITESRSKTYLFLPIVGALFLYILFSNWVALIPGTGSLGLWREAEGAKEFIPFFRPAMSDYNSTLSLAVFAVLASHFMGLRLTGFYAHLNKFLKIDGILHSFKHGIVAVLVALVDFGVGLIEIVGEFAKMLSLSLRLFGNVFAGEMLLTVISSLIAFGAPLPFISLELLVGLIQASIFTILTVVYMTTTSAEHESHA